MDRTNAPAEDGEADRLVVKIPTACRMLDVSRTRIYVLMDAGELQSFKDGKSRKITVASIRAYVARRLAERAAA